MSVPFMQLYIGDYLRDTGGLSTEGHGAYLLLLMAMWNAGGRLPNDPAKLARFSRLSPARWAKLSHDVMPFFTEDGGFITQKRLSGQLEKANRKSEVSAASGALGGKARALKTNGSVQADASGSLRHLPESRSHTEEDSPLRSESGAIGEEDLFGDRPPEKPKTSASKAKTAKSDPKAPPGAFERWYLTYPNKKARPKAEAAYLKAWEQIAATGEDPEPILLEGVQVLIRSKRISGQSMPYPASWLNAGRWTDEEDTDGPANGGSTIAAPPSRHEQRKGNLHGALVAAAHREREPGGGAQDHRALAVAEG